MSDIRLEDQTVGIYLRKMTVDDTDNIVKWRNKEAVRSRFLYREPFTPEGHLQWIKTKIDTGLTVQMIICTGEDAPIGSVYLRDIDRLNRKAEYGIFIGEEAALGKGYGTAAAKLMLRYGFEQLSMHKIFLRVLADNARAIASYEKAGFEREAYLKDEVFLDGKFCDIVFMAMIR